MTHLRKITLEELQRRHYSEGTTRYYIRHVERFARHFNRSPDSCVMTRILEALSKSTLAKPRRTKQNRRSLDMSGVL